MGNDDVDVDVDVDIDVDVDVDDDVLDVLKKEAASPSPGLAFMSILTSF